LLQDSSLPTIPFGALPTITADWSQALSLGPERLLKDNPEEACSYKFN
jgi:hypothetical protein